MATTQHLYYRGGVHHVAVSANTATNNSLVAAQGAGKRIVVLSCLLIAAGAVDVNFESANTNISGVMSLPANGGFALNHNPLGWCITAANEALGMTLGGGVQVSGTLTYQVID